MKLVLFYGPMAVGKLTVAESLKALCDKNNYPIKIFHNHHTVDLITEFIPSMTEEWFYLNSLFRLELIESCVKIGQNLISTHVYAKGDDDEYLRKMIHRVQKHNSSIIFVQLQADLEILYSRLDNESRKKYRKLTSRVGYEDTMSKYDIFSRIPFVESLSFNTGKDKPASIANKVFDVLTS